MTRGLRTPSGLDGRSYGRLELESTPTSDSTRYELILIRRLFIDCFLQTLGCLVFVVLSTLRSLLLQESAYSWDCLDIRRIDLIRYWSEPCIADDLFSSAVKDNFWLNWSQIHITCFLSSYNLGLKSTWFVLWFLRWIAFLRISDLLCLRWDLFINALQSASIFYLRWDHMYLIRWILSGLTLNSGFHTATIRALDQITLATWLIANGLTATFLGLKA
jgi:hypothetical protein